MNESHDEDYPLISVIVPVYRVEKYLEQCVCSICNQTYTNLEIILVDDGSPDRCPQMCDDFAETDKRIRVIHKLNGGLSDARNTGTEWAAGEYILYVDSDDFVHTDMIRRMYCAMTESSSQAAVCSFCSFAKEAEILKCRFQNKIRFYSGDMATREMLYQRIENTACGKLLPRSICEHFLFPVGRFYEDLFVMYKMLYYCENIAFLDQPLYFYRNNPDSIMHRPFSVKSFDLLDAADEIVCFAQENKPSLLPAAKARKFSAYAQVLRWMPDSVQFARQLEIWKEIKNYRWNMLCDKNARLKNRLGALCTLLGRRIFKEIANKFSR